MTRTLKSLLAVACLQVVLVPAMAQDLGSSIVGVWKLTSLTRQDTGSGEIKPFYGERQGGYRIFTKGGHAFVFNVYTPRKKPAGPDPTDAERAELFKSSSAYTGKYNVDGDKVTIRIDGSWVESWTGTDRVNVVKIAGNRMTMTSLPFKNALDGKEIVLVSTLERVE